MLLLLFLFPTLVATYYLLVEYFLNTNGSIDAMCSTAHTTYIISSCCEVLLANNQCITYCYLLKNVLIHATYATCHLVIAIDAKYYLFSMCYMCYLLHALLVTYYVCTACKVLCLSNFYLLLFLPNCKAMKPLVDTHRLFANRFAGC